MKQWNIDDEKLLIENYNRGIVYCSGLLNRTINSVYNKSNKMGLRKNIKSEEFTEEQLDILIKNYPIFGFKYVSELLKMPKNSIKMKVNKLGLEVNRLLWNERISESKLKNHKDFKDFKVNPEQFLNINTKEIAYILGFLWADGYIRNDVINTWIKKEDGLDIKHIFDKTGDWNNYYRFKNSNDRKEQICFLTNNRFIYDFLVDNEFKYKSYVSPDKILKAIPIDIKHYFFRGYFDGDGCVYYKKNIKTSKFSKLVSLTSTHEQDWNFIKKLFNEIDIKLKILKSRWKKEDKEYKSSRITIQNEKDIIKFCEYIYNGYEVDKIGLKRKYEIYEKLKNRIN